MYKLEKTTEFDEWLNAHSLKHKIQIEKRLLKIIREGYFGDHKFLSGVVWELRWNIGWRVYYAHLAEKNILILLGGNKNGQSKDITQAKTIFSKNAEVSP